MKCVVLAAGYGTRLQPAIGDFPKPLVEVGGVTVLDHLLAVVGKVIPPLDTTIVCNARYFHHFASWQASSGKEVMLLNDGSTGPEDRLGAIRDVEFAISKTGLDDDVLVLAADNILRFELADFVVARPGEPVCRVAIRHNPDPEDQKRRGVVALGEHDRIVRFDEKPQDPQSQWAAAPIYVFPREVLPLVSEFLTHGGNPDAPGFLLEFLVNKVTVQGWRMPGEILDIGSPESLRLAREALAP